MYKPSVYANSKGEKWLTVSLHGSTFLSCMVEMALKGCLFWRCTKSTATGCGAEQMLRSSEYFASCQDEGQTPHTSEGSCSSGARWRLAPSQGKHNGLALLNYCVDDQMWSDILKMSTGFLVLYKPQTWSLKTSMHGIHTDLCIWRTSQVEPWILNNYLSFLMPLLRTGIIFCLGRKCSKRFHTLGLTELRRLIFIEQLF